MAAEESSMADAALADAKATLMSHTLPKARQRTNVYKDVCQPRGRLFGARVLPKPPSGFPKLCLRFTCWLLLDLLVLQPNPTLI